MGPAFLRYTAGYCSLKQPNKHKASKITVRLKAEAAPRTSKEFGLRLAVQSLKSPIEPELAGNSYSR